MIQVIDRLQIEEDGAFIERRKDSHEVIVGFNAYSKKNFKSPELAYEFIKSLEDMLYMLEPQLRAEVTPSIAKQKTKETK